MFDEQSYKYPFVGSEEKCKDYASHMGVEKINMDD